MPDSKKNQYNLENLERDMKELKFENRIQTVAVALFFFFGIATIADIYKKMKK